MTERVTWADSLQEQFGSAPWWMISAGLHVVVLMLLALVTLGLPEKPDAMLLLEVGVPVRKPPPVEPYVPPGLKPRPEIDGEGQETFVPHDEFEVAEEMEMDDAGEDRGSLGRPEALSDIECGGPAALCAIGPGGGGVGKRGWWNRRGRRDVLEGKPGGKAIIAAFEAALRWLARHQEPDGRWDGEKYGGQNTDAGITGLAVLAFLGAGHTQTVGKYKNVVAKGVRWMISQEDAEGCIGRNFQRGLGYHHSICGLALAEDYGMTRIRRVGEAAQKAVEWSIQRHQCEYSGWRYSPKQAPDTSVTGWFVMQLKSAKVAGLRVEGSGFQGAINWLDAVSTKPGAEDPYGGRVSYREGRAPSPTMTSVGVLCRELLGWKASDPVVRGGVEYLMQNLPRWERVNFYYLYYGTLATYMSGGEHWNGWRLAMKETLIPNQRKGGDDDGSWDPAGRWCSAGGRVYSTAMGALSLEVEVRYLPLYK